MPPRVVPPPIRPLAPAAPSHVVRPKLSGLRELGLGETTKASPPTPSQNYGTTPSGLQCGSKAPSLAGIGLLSGLHSGPPSRTRGASQACLAHEVGAVPKTGSLSSAFHSEFRQSGGSPFGASTGLGELPPLLSMLSDGADDEGPPLINPTPPPLIRPIPSSGLPAKPSQASGLAGLLKAVKNAQVIQPPDPVLPSSALAERPASTTSWRPPPPPGMPASLLEQLREQMRQTQGATGKACHFGRQCKSVDCPNLHPDGRDIEDDLQSVICAFGRRCKRTNCFYVHPAGRVIDEDPSKGMCKLGESCTRPGCVFTHPDSRVAATHLRCFFCGELGHVHKDCPRHPQTWQPKVVVTGFPKDWTDAGEEGLSQRVQNELEAFGPLAATPEVSENSTKVTAVFKEAEHAKRSVTNLNGEVFEIDWVTPPPVNMPASVSSNNRDKRCTIFVGNIPYDTTEEELHDVFSRVGIISSLRIVYDKDTKQPKGYGFCDYTDPAIAQDALKYLQDVELRGRRLRLTQADHALRAHDGMPATGASGDKPYREAREDSPFDIQIKGFPQRWNADDMKDFLQGAVKGTIVGVTMPSTSSATVTDCATVSFSSEHEAKRACSDLQGQKIAGKPLTVLINGAVVQESGGAGGKSGDQERYLRSRSPSFASMERERPPKKKDDDNKRDTDKNDRNDRRENKGREKHLFVAIHIDELAMPQKPYVQPSATDREVWIDPFPDVESLEQWLATFGEVDDVFRIPDHNTGDPSDRGYVRFKEHSAAEHCVAGGCATWSESERTISSQKSARHGPRSSAYPESIVGKILGARGEAIVSLRDEIGASMLSLRGEGLGEHDRLSSQRVHFVCKGPPETLSKLQPALERAMAKVHAEIRDKIQAIEAGGKRSPHRDHRDNHREHWDHRDRPDEAAPWRPPGREHGGGGWAPPPPWGYGPPAGYPGGPPAGPPGAWPPPPWGAHPDYGPHGSWPPHPWMHPGGGPPPPGGTAQGPPGLPGPPGPPPGHHGVPPPPGSFQPGPPPTDPPHHGDNGEPEGEGRSRRRRRRTEDDPAGGAGVGGSRKRRKEADDGNAAMPRGSRSRERRKRRHKEGEEVVAAPQHHHHPRIMSPSRSRSCSRRRRRRRGQGEPARSAAEPTEYVEGRRGGSHRHGGGAENPAHPGGSPQNFGGEPTQAADSGRSVGDGFLANLPGELTELERELRQAVIGFLRDWSKEHKDGSNPNLVHLGADARIRSCKASALPREVALKTWLKQRLTHEIEVQGQMVVLCNP